MNERAKLVIQKLHEHGNHAEAAAWERKIKGAPSSIDQLQADIDRLTKDTVAGDEDAGMADQVRRDRVALGLDPAPDQPLPEGIRAMVESDRRALGRGEPAAGTMDEMIQADKAALGLQ